MHAETDAQLLDRARTGDAPALEALLGRHQARVYRFGLRMCRDPQDAQDIAQDTLLAMARGVRDFRGGSSISTWLYTVARSFCIKKRRRSKYAPEPELSMDEETTPDVADPARSPEEDVAGRQVEDALARAIAALEPKYREVLVLRDVEGLTAPEVAEILGIRVQAVKSRLHRARLAVRARVAPLLGIPTDVPVAAGTCPDVLTLFSRHLEDDIGPDVCAEMERHLEACPRCKGACDSLKRTLALCSTSGREVEVPDAVKRQVHAALRDLLAEQG